MTVPRSAIDHFAAAIDPHVMSLSSFEVDPDGPWRVQGLAMQKPDGAILAGAVALAARRAGIDEPVLECRRLEAVDWLAANRASFRPIRVGRFFVRPSHDAERPPPGALTLTLDAGEAFGTGSHATTRSCLMAIDAMARAGRPGRVLDVGCGSGILAIAAAKVWGRPVVATDIDPVSVRVSRGNARSNGVAGLVRLSCGPGLRAAAVRTAGPFDLVLANILARPLARLAPALRRYTSPGARVVLSGILGAQEPFVLAAYRTEGFALDRRIALDGWHTLIVRRRTGPR